MIDPSGMVKEFQRKHHIAVAGWPRIPNPGELVTRFRLMNEELAELEVALHEGRIVATADALADLLYVVYGTANACGIPIDAVFAEVHRSNMTKPGLDEHGKGGKITKEGWSPPDLAPLLWPRAVSCPSCGEALITQPPKDGETAWCKYCGLTPREVI